MPSGEIFYVSADKLPQGGQDAIRRILFDQNGTAKTMLELIKEKNTAQGKTPAARADLRFGGARTIRSFCSTKPTARSGCSCADRQASVHFPPARWASHASSRTASVLSSPLAVWISRSGRRHRSGPSR